MSEDDVARFNDLAAEYLACIDAAGGRGEEATMRAVAAILGSLHSTAFRLPLVEPESADASDETEPGDAYDVLYRLLGDAGIGRYYWDFAPFLGAGPGARVVGDLADDLADIYLDLRRGFAFLDGGGSANDAVWEWRCSFEVHWGKRAVDALRVIHAQLTDERDASRDE